MANLWCKISGVSDSFKRKFKSLHFGVSAFERSFCSPTKSDFSKQKHQLSLLIVLNITFFNQIHNFIKKYEIETLNCKVEDTSNQLFQSRLRKEIVGSMDGLFQIHAIHTPTSTIAIVIPVNFIDFEKRILTTTNYTPLNLHPYNLQNV